MQTELSHGSLHSLEGVVAPKRIARAQQIAIDIVISISFMAWCFLSFWIENPSFLAKTMDLFCARSLVSMRRLCMKPREIYGRTFFLVLECSIDKTDVLRRTNVLTSPFSIVDRNSIVDPCRSGILFIVSIGLRLEESEETRVFLILFFCIMDACQCAELL